MGEWVREKEREKREREENTIIIPMIKAYNHLPYCYIADTREQFIFYTKPNFVQYSSSLSQTV
jgi:hypothetical protein